MALERTSSPYAWLPTLVVAVAATGFLFGYLGLASFRTRLVERAGRSLAFTAAESVDELDAVVGEHARRLRRLGRDGDLAGDDVRRLGRVLRDYRRRHHDYRWLAVVDRDGRIAAATDATSVGIAAAELATARATGVDVRTVAAGGERLLRMTVPIVDAGGRDGGALIARTPLRRIERIVDRSIRNLRRNWGAPVRVAWQLVDASGGLVASDPVRRPDEVASPPALANAATSPGYFEEADATGDAEIVTGYARTRPAVTNESSRWTLLVHVDRRDVVGPMHRTIALLAMLWLLVTAPPIALTAWATARLRRAWTANRAERLRAEAARREADVGAESLRAVLDHAAEGIVTIDAAGTIRSANPAALRMFGFTDRDPCGAHVARLLASGVDGSHDGTVARWLPRAAARARGTTLVARRADGERIPVGLSLSRVDDGGEAVYVGIVRDLSEQRRAEADHGLLVSIIEHTDDFVALASLEGRVLFVNPAGRALLGVSPQAGVSSLELEAFVHPSDRARFAATIVPTVLEHGRWQGDMHVRHLTSDEAIAVAVNLFLVRHTATGRATGFAAVCRDVREQHRIEADTERARALVRAKEMAEAASLAKSEFLATMSHEIRTPLNGVVGLTGLLLDTRLSDEQREYAESLGVCTAALLGVIDDVLDFSKMDAGKLTLEHIDFELRRTVEEVVDLFAERAHGKGIELVTAVDPRTPDALRGDPHRLRQILTNLLSNALKFTARGEVVVRVGALANDGQCARVQIAVGDTGIGIAPERQAMIFESFSQTDVSTPRLYGGSGLGLAIVKRLAELMNGQIVVDSEPGAGSTFSLMVPLAVRPAPAPAPPARAFAGRRVLVVDDNPTVRAVLRSYLRRLGARATCTDDGAHALSLLRAAHARRRPFHVALLDWEMPVLDGIELARAIKRDPTIASTPIVLATALGQRRAGRRAARHVGIAAFVSKPVRAERLESCLLDALEPGARRRARGDGAATTTPVFRAGLCALVAEDDPISRKIAVRLLEKRGIQVDAVGDGRSAVEACIRRRYDLVLMDCRLPELDGVAATVEIRRREPAGHRSPIVALTANATPEVERQCAVAGMDGCLRKPIRTETLDAALARWLATPTAGPAVTSPASPVPVLDVDGLLDRVDGDTAFVRDLLAGLRRDAPRWLGELREAIARRELATVVALAHTIRGSVGNLGGMRAASVAGRIEETAQGAGATPAACDDLAREIDRLASALARVGDPHVAAS